MGAGAAQTASPRSAKPANQIPGMPALLALIAAALFWLIAAALQRQLRQASALCILELMLVALPAYRRQLVGL